MVEVVAARLTHCFGRMAAHQSDSFQRPLQNAMRLVKVAIQLDTGNKHKVQTFESLTLLVWYRYDQKPITVRETDVIYLLMDLENRNVSLILQDPADYVPIFIQYFFPVKVNKH